MVPRSIIAAILALLFGSLAEARNCDPPRVTHNVDAGTTYYLDVSTLAGASDIRVEESFRSDFQTTVGTTTWHAPDKPFFVHGVDGIRQLFYRVTALNESDPSFVPCTFTTDVTIFPTAELRAQFRHSVIPVAGSLNGANGSRFRTAMTLLNPYDAGNLRGRIVFHPAGASGRSDDPSLRYDLGPQQHVEYTDVVAAIGASGLGSLDVVPDDDASSAVPLAHVTVYNDSGNGATFGMSVPQVRAQDFYQGVPELDIIVPDRAMRRVNIGIRSGAIGGTVTAVIRAAGASPKQIQHIYPADEFVQSSLDDFAGVPLATGDTITIYPFSVIAYAAETNNMTNDPEMQTTFSNVTQWTNDTGTFFK